MSLTVALNSARSSLMASGMQSSVISRNIAGARQDGYSRKIAVLDPPGNWRLCRGYPARRQRGSVLQCPEGLLDHRQAECDLRRSSEDRGYHG